jgi:hypothetical protein
MTQEASRRSAPAPRAGARGAGGSRTARAWRGRAARSLERAADLLLLAAQHLRAEEFVQELGVAQRLLSLGDPLAVDRADAAQLALGQLMVKPQRHRPGPAPAKAVRLATYCSSWASSRSTARWLGLLGRGPPGRRQRASIFGRAQLLHQLLERGDLPVPLGGALAAHQRDVLRDRGREGAEYVALDQRPPVACGRNRPRRTLG